VPLAAPDDDDDDISGCSNLADAAAKVWEELMVKRECAKDVGALFYLGELKDGVERAAKRVDVLRREASAAAQKVDEKETALSELCSHIEEKSIANGSIAQWKLGDMAIRRGKGFCELSMVHHEADPPYYEVRMVTTGSVVGVEAGNLLELQPQQKSLVRNALREVEQAKARAVSAEECEVQAQEELKKQHQALTEQVEKKLQDSASTAATQPSAAAAAPVGGRSAPPGLPDMDLVRRWGGRGAIPSTAAKPEAMPAVADYPDMRGLREDFRSPSLPEANTTPRVTGTAPAPTPTVPPGAPVGFPSLEELQRMEGRAAAERERQATAATYPSAHPAAAREVFSRPGAAERAEAHPSARRPSQFGSRQQTPDRSPTPADTSVGAARAGSKEPNVPAGFPRLDPKSGPEFAGQGPQRPRVQPQPQAQQGQHYQHPQQQQGPAAAQPGPVLTEWVVYRTDQGVPYYHNERTNETVWQLPPGARWREPGVARAAAGAAGQAAGHWQQQEQQGQAAADDPFAELRSREEEMRQQREHWAQWYAQYCAWYTQQAQAAYAGGVPGGGIPAGAPPVNGGQRHQAPPQFGTEPNAGVKLPPKGPAPPTLDAGFEDQATYAIKSSVLKEMEAMVAKGAPVAQRKKALRCLQMRWHPDKNPERLEVANSVFQFIEETKPWFLHDPEAAESGVT